MRIAEYAEEHPADQSTQSSENGVEIDADQKCHGAPTRFARGGIMIYRFVMGIVDDYKGGVRGQESGVRGQESGVRGQESGVRGQESGVRGSGLSNAQFSVPSTQYCNFLTPLTPDS